MGRSGYSIRGTFPGIARQRGSPESIKLAPLIRELQSRPAEFHTRTCVTAQHRGMLDQALAAFGIVPDHDLEVMRDGQDLFHLTALCLERLRPVLEAERPDWVLV